jgi:hypothetical protein
MPPLSDDQQRVGVGALIVVAGDEVFVASGVDLELGIVVAVPV